jgi:riboflavin synthase
MFTGIISHLGKLEAIKESHYAFSAEPSFFVKLKKGGSVSVNGICLTVIAMQGKNTFSVEVIPETLKRTMLDELRPGFFVNLELPVSPSDVFAGHIVQGHIDGKGTIASIKKEANDSWLFKIEIDKNLSKYLIEKGSVAVSGISLTIIEAGSAFFTVGIIPYTWKNTVLKYGKIGDRVNIEIDVIAKYVEKFVSNEK